MRIAELIQLRQFRVIEGPAEDPGPGQVQARVESVGVCGSDLHYFSEGGIGDTPCVYPMVLGHEPTGVVVKTGPGVTGWSPGDRAALEPAIYCYHCEFCLSGRHNVCARLRFLSTPLDPGFFRDYVNLPAHNLLSLPPNVGFHEGTLFEPLAVILHSMKFVSIGIGETAAVFGAGPIGLLTILMLKVSGAGRVWAVEPVAHRRELARVAGADAVVDPASVDPVRQILNETGQRGVDVAVDCVARGDSMNQSILVTRSAGRVVYTGIPSETLIPLALHDVRRKELVLHNVRRSNHESDAALELLRTHGRLFAPIVTHTRPLDQLQPAFTMLEHYADGVGKLVIRLGKGSSIK